MSVSGAIWPYCFSPGRGLASYMRITRHPLGYFHFQGRWASFLCRGRSGALFACYLVCLLCQDCVFPIPGPGDYRFHIAGAQRDPTIPSSTLFVPPASSPYLDTNAGIGLRATESSDCSTLQLFQTNQMWG